MLLHFQSTVGVSKNQMAGLYDLEETIGEGHYAVVKLAKHVFTGEKVAVKVRNNLWCKLLFLSGGILV